MATAKESNGTQKRPAAPPTRLPDDTLENAIKKTAPKMLQGGEYFNREDYVVAQMASYYGAEKEEVVKALREAIDALPKVDKKEVNPEKKAEAERAERDAADAEREAEEAKVAAEKARQKATAAKAEAEGKVLVDVPRDYAVNFGGMVHRFKKGVQTMIEEIADHPYSKASGVKVLGLPIDAVKK